MPSLKFAAPGRGPDCPALEPPLSRLLTTSHFKNLLVLKIFVFLESVNHTFPLSVMSVSSPVVDHIVYPNLGIGALVASTWSTKITDSEDSDAENELSNTLPENILELFNSDTVCVCDESDFEGFR
ncbi:hypothetical protein TNCV_1237281 [Trichonephila clavipes]|nr:hypothetical protein TNCV_1237281 [Trichonephila clavipes]